MASFAETLHTQRWDDHRFYHHSIINQSLHLISAISFLVAYCMAFFDPAMAAVVAWCVGMLTRQSGHFFFEPRSYDHVNDVTHEYKEAVKVGYNLFRKVVLMVAWAALPVLIWFEPTLFGLLPPADGFMGFVRHVGEAWLALGVLGLLFRMAQLVVLQNAQAAFCWGFKIITDPFHDIKLYYRSPLALMRGDLIDESIAHH